VNRDDNGTPSDAMTRRERDDLAALARRREKVAKTAAKERSAHVLAEIEAKLSDAFDAEDALWADVTRAAQAEIAKADAAIAARCREVGVPEKFRPTLDLLWRGRGVNADPGRRSELRRLAQARVAALEKSALAAIERASVETQTALLAGGLTTDEARGFLDAMPSVDGLLPPLTVEQLEAALPTGERTSERERLALLSYGYWQPPALPAEADE
jgi:hypothetical protein